MNKGCSVGSGIFKKTSGMLNSYYQEYTNSLQFQGLYEAAKTNITELRKKVKYIKKKRGEIVMGENGEVLMGSSSEEEEEEHLARVLPPIMPVIPEATLESGGTSLAVYPLPIRIIRTPVAPANEEFGFVAAPEVIKKRNAPRHCKNCGQTWNAETQEGCKASQPRTNFTCNNPLLVREVTPVVTKIYTRKAVPKPPCCKNCGKGYNTNTKSGCPGATRGILYCNRPK